MRRLRCRSRGVPRAAIPWPTATPTSLGTSQLAPLSGVKPRVTNGSQKRLSSAAMVKSAASASWQPRPAAQPRTAHTTGSWTSKSIAIRRCACSGVRRCRLPGRGFWTDALEATQSEPEQKSAPEPVSRMARSESSVAADSNVSTRRRTAATSSAPLRSGRSMTMRNRPSWTSTPMPSPVPPLMTAPR